MIVTIPTQAGPLSFCLNAPMLKLIALLFGLISIVAGYAVVQLSAFVLACTPQQFVHIILFTAFLVGLLFLGRFVLNRKGASI